MMDFSLAIIGAGLAGTAALCQFLRRVAPHVRSGRFPPDRIGLTVIERQEILGPGFPHNEKNLMDFHLINMCAEDMGILAEDPGDFMTWLDEHPHLMVSGQETPAGDPRGNGPSPQACHIFPRILMGEYLQARFRESVRMARNLGISITTLSSHEVVDLEDRDQGFRLHVQPVHQGERIAIDVNRVILATGHWFEKSNSPRYLSSPWPAFDLLNRIPPGETVGILGSSLTALDTVLTLFSDGRFRRDSEGRLLYEASPQPRRITLYSRNGLLPRVRGRPGQYVNRFFTWKNLRQHLQQKGNRLGLKQVFQWLDADLQTAYGRPVNWQRVLPSRETPVETMEQYLREALHGDGPGGALIWQTVLHQAFPMARHIYLSLSPEDRQTFERDYAALFFSYASVIPIINAEKILALLRTGLLDVVKIGSAYQLIENQSIDGFHFTYRDGRGRLQKRTCDYVVDARGQPRSFEKNPSTLARNLVQSGLVQTTGHGREDPIPVPSHGPAPSSVFEGDNAVSRPFPSKQPQTGSILIDPDTHLTFCLGSHGEQIPSDKLYAIGAMTRDQIIDASMARSIAVSTDQVAEHLIEQMLGGIYSAQGE